MDHLIRLSYGLNSTTTVLLQVWLWHWITHEGWYAIKQRSQTKPEKIICCFLKILFCESLDYLNEYLCKYYVLGKGYKIDKSNTYWNKRIKIIYCSKQVIQCHQCSFCYLLPNGRVHCVSKIGMIPQQLIFEIYYSKKKKNMGVKIYSITCIFQELLLVWVS